VKLYEQYLYYGGIPIGYNVENPSPQYLRRKTQVSIAEQVHCVVILVNAEILVDPSTMKMIRRQIEIIQSSKHSSIRFLVLKVRHTN
jgi:hypothetical protein